MEGAGSHTKNEGEGPPNILNYLSHGINLYQSIHSLLTQSSYQGTGKYLLQIISSFT